MREPVCLCVLAVSGGQSWVTQSKQQFRWEAKEKVPSWTRQGLGLQCAHALELPRGTHCLTWSIPSNGKRSVCRPGVEDLW